MVFNWSVILFLPAFYRPYYFSFQGNQLLLNDLLHSIICSCKINSPYHERVNFFEKSFSLEIDIVQFRKDTHETKLFFFLIRTVSTCTTLNIYQMRIHKYLRDALKMIDNTNLFIFFSNAFFVIVFISLLRRDSI
jgi:hypothetical protein